MRIATFNANSLRARLEIVVEWLTRHTPDVLAIQETKVVDEEFPVDAVTAAGYSVVFRGQKSYNGVALLSRSPATDVAFGFDDDGPADDTRLVRACVNGVHIVNTYVPQGRELDHDMYPYKLEWYARLRRYFDRHFNLSDKLVWMGDMNVAPGRDDIHHADEQENDVCFHVDVRRAFANTVSWGFVDVFRKHHPEPGCYTFFDYRTPDALARNLGWRIDHILATPELAAMSTNAFIDLEPRRKDKPSDHTFLVADFNV